MCDVKKYSRMFQDIKQLQPANLLCTKCWNHNEKRSRLWFRFFRYCVII